MVKHNKIIGKDPCQSFNKKFMKKLQNIKHYLIQKCVTVQQGNKEI